MRLRPYCDSSDYPYIEKWVDSGRIHALWCAGLIPYPLSRKDFNAFLERDAKEWGGKAFTAMLDDGTPAGFLIYSVNEEENSGFLKFVLLDGSLRGKGLGGQMIRLALEHAFAEKAVSFVQINVFDVNKKARACYKKAGFLDNAFTENVFCYQDEQWGRYNMRITSSDYKTHRAATR